MSRFDSEAWSNSRDTGEHAFPELGGDGPHVYVYDVRGVKHRQPTRLHRIPKREEAQFDTVPFTVVNGVVTFAPTIDARGVSHVHKALALRYGKRWVIEILSSSNKQLWVRWQCVCGNTGRMKAARWRCEAIHAGARARAHNTCKLCSKSRRDAFKGVVSTRGPIIPYYKMAGG